VTDDQDRGTVPQGIDIVRSMDSVTFRIDGEVTIDELGLAFGRFAELLAALQEQGEANVRWVLADLSYSSAIAVAQAVPQDDDAVAAVPALVRSYLDAAKFADGRIEIVGLGAIGSRVLDAVLALTELAGVTHAVVLETDEDDVVFHAPALRVAPAGPQNAPNAKSYGTVRGRVETVSRHRRLRFNLYELATDRSVSCYLKPGDEEMMRDAWGKVADVAGTVTRDGLTGRALAIRGVTDVRVVDEGDPLGFLRALGVVPAKDPAEVVIRRVRDAS